jgi:hypothetical protein
MIEAICPKCEKINRVGDELIGRYTLCENCRCRFYVYVPAIEPAREPSLSRIKESPAPPTTLDDLLWDNQQGGRHVLKSLAEHQRLLRRTYRTLFMVAVLAAANLVLLMVLLAR